MLSLKFETKINKADKKIIDQHLMEAGFGECLIDLEYQELKIPDFHKPEQALISSVVSQAGHYRLDVLTDDVILDD